MLAVESLSVAEIAVFVTTSKLSVFRDMIIQEEVNGEMFADIRPAAAARG